MDNNIKALMSPEALIEYLNEKEIFKIDELKNDVYQYGLLLFKLIF